MYLLASGAPRTSNKWRMGRLATYSTDQTWRLRGLGLSPVRLPNLGRLGQSPAQPCVYYGADGSTVESVDYNSNVTECTVNGGSWQGVAPIGTPALPAGGQNASPVAGGASNGGITTVMATQPSTNPLDYTSPQAAIAAGLDPTTVYAKWSAALAQFPSPQAAIAAGVPAGVVNQLWQSAHVAAANAPQPSALASAAPWLVAAGIGLFAVKFIARGRR